VSTVSFTVYGVPRPQGSKKHVGKGIMVETNKNLPHWRGAVAQAAAQADGSYLTVGPVQLTVQFVFPRPKGHYGSGKNSGVLKASAPSHPTSKQLGDLDKLLRGLCDAITGVLIADDSQVVGILATKEYGEPAQAAIRMETFNNG